MSKYTRHQSIISRYSDSYIDEDNWYNKLEKSLQKDAVQPRTVDQSIFEQITSIMNGKSKYPSVQAAVDDMKNRSGLTAYLDNLSKLSNDEQEIQKKLASHNNGYYKRGFEDGQNDLRKGQASDILAGLRAFLKKYEVPYNEWINYAQGYANGAKFSDEIKKLELDKIKKYLKLNKKEASDNNKVIDKNVDIMPIVFVKCPKIRDTTQNYIETTRGNLSVPAIVDKIRSIHQGDVSNASDWEDDKLIRHISKLNLTEKSKNHTQDDYNNLGKNDDINDVEIDPSNTDAFHALTPVKF